jgi:hypothetical protein
MGKVLKGFSNNLHLTHGKVDLLSNILLIDQRDHIVDHPLLVSPLVLVNSYKASRHCQTGRSSR